VAEHANVIRVTHFSPAAGKRDELSALLDKLAESIRSIEGCFGVQVCAVREAPEELAVVSRWASQGALDQLNEFVSSRMADVTPMVAGPTRTEHFTPL
jgi:quinol monooxygenase YgiN